MASQANENYLPVLKNLCVYWKILGLCPFVFEKDTIGDRSYSGIFYASILTVSYIILYCRVVINRTSHIMTRETPMTVLTDFLGITTDFLMVIAAWICVTIRHDDLQKIVKMFKKIQETSKTIDMSQDFQRFFGVIKLHTIVLNITWIILCIGDHLLLYDMETFKLDIWVPFNVPRIISHNIVMMFIDVLWMMKKFFSSLNERILNLSKEVTVSLVISEGNQSSLKNSSHQSFPSLSSLELCGQIHSDLVTLTKMIVEYFSLCITLVLLEHLILLASDLYALGLMTLDQNFLSWRKILTFLDMSCWCWVHFLESAIVIAISDSTANKANRTGSVLHIMLTMNSNRKYDVSAQVLSLRLLQRRLTIELYGFIQLRLSVVHKILGMVITYVTIMMQIDIHDLQRRHGYIQMLQLNTTHVG